MADRIHVEVYLDAGSPSLYINGELVGGLAPEDPGKCDHVGWHLLAANILGAVLKALVQAEVRKLREEA